MKRKKHTTWLLVLAIIAVVGLIVYLEEPRGSDLALVNSTIQKEGRLSPELAGIAGYINTENLTISSLVGQKVVLVDIWTYSCINCQRTLPYITAWHEKYKDHGLEIIGVHSPEFGFEKKYDNVLRAVKKWNIKYPVVLDNDHATWRAFQNNYWPRKYLMDLDGYVVYDHIGEGGYEETEREIQRLLIERKARLGLQDGMTFELATVSAPTVDFRKIGTPEIYLGSSFTRGNFGSPEGLLSQQTITYKPVDKRRSNDVYLEGIWHVGDDHVRLVSDTGKVHLRFTAKNANIVAGVSGNVTVTLDGDETKKFKVKEQDLYELAMADDYSTKDLTFEIDGAGFELYTFTFG